MTKIDLTNGLWTFVDDDLFEALRVHKWCYHKDGYAVTNILQDDKWVSTPMHKLIISAPPSLITDHIDKDKLFNSRFNLRFVTKKANSLNNKASGAYLDKRSGKYQASVGSNNLGTFKTKQEAEAVAQEERKRQLLIELSVTRPFNLHLTDDQYYRTF